MIPNQAFFHFCLIREKNVFLRNLRDVQDMHKWVVSDTVKYVEIWPLSMAITCNMNALCVDWTWRTPYPPYPLLFLEFHWNSHQNKCLKALGIMEWLKQQSFFFLSIQMIFLIIYILKLYNMTAQSWKRFQHNMWITLSVSCPLRGKVFLTLGQNFTMGWYYFTREFTQRLVKLNNPRGTKHRWSKLRLPRRIVSMTR